jgi:hypothetical protein
MVCARSKNIYLFLYSFLPLRSSPLSSHSYSLILSSLMVRRPAGTNGLPKSWPRRPRTSRLPQERRSGHRIAVAQKCSVSQAPDALGWHASHTITSVSRGAGTRRWRTWSSVLVSAMDRCFLCLFLDSTWRLDLLALPLPRLGRRCVCVLGARRVMVLQGPHGERHLLLLLCRPSVSASSMIRCSDSNPMMAMAPLGSDAVTTIMWKHTLLE